MSTPTAAASSGPRPLPPVLGRLLSGTFWLALRTPLQALFALWSIPLVLHAIGPDANGAYNFAWGFGFVQFLLEFGMSSALQREVSERWTRGDRDGVDRAIACGMSFYAAMALLQAGVLLAVAYYALPRSGYSGAAYALAFRLLWLQALTAPCYGLMTVVSSILQAARRYDFIPRCELAIVVLRFGVLVAGLWAGIGFFWIVAAQTAVSVGLGLGPALWVMARELGHVPHFRGARRADFRALTRLSFFVFLIQLSVVLADKVDTTILGFALDDPGLPTSVYQVVSKPFLQIRQTGWMLAYLVMPAVASLAAARDERALDRIKYDGPRLLVGLLAPVGLLAGLYAEPFLALWIGPEFARYAGLMRLFLVATLPLVLAVPVQMAIGMGKAEVVALAALAGAAVNLPLSYWLTLRIGMPGVIWGTVLTTLLSNLLVPGAYVFRLLGVRPATFLARTLGAPLAGAAALVAACGAFRALVPPGPVSDRSLAAAVPLLANLLVGVLAYLAGYGAVPSGRADLAALARRLGLRRAADA